MTYGESAPAGPRTGGDRAVETLVSAGVQVVFGLHGAHVEAIFQSCLDRGVRIVDTRHEAAAGHAAEGYARAGRRLGVVVVTAGPGFANAVISMTNAAVDRTPVLYVAGAAPLDDAETNTLQSGIDQLAVAAPIVKWAYRVTRTADVGRLVAQAVRVATSAPAGPVYLEIPIDVMNAVADIGPFAVQPLATGGPPDAATIGQIATAIAGAERPVLLAGAPMYHGRGDDVLRQLVERTGVPLFAEFEAMGTVPSSHPLFGGTAWQLPRLAARHQPDLVVALGIRFGWDAPGFRETVTAPVIHVDVDGAEIGRLRPPLLGVVADPVATVRALVDHLDATAAAPPPDRAAWVDTVRSTVAAMRADVVAQRAPTGIHAAAAADVVCRAAGPDACIVADGAFTKHWLDDVVQPDRPGGYLTHGRLGAMGIGNGLAVGAGLADPLRRVVLVTGDGSVGFNIAEFDTMVRHGLAITVVVMNNRGWGASRVLQTAQRGPERIVGTGLGDARYDLVMAAFGGDGYRATTLDQLDAALGKAFAADGPTCIEVVLDGDHGFPPAMRSALTR